MESSQNDTLTVWSKCLPILRERLPVPTFETFVRSASPVLCKGDTFQFEVGAPLMKDWLESKCKQLIMEVLREVTGKNLRISFALGNGASKPGENWEAESLIGKILIEENQSPLLCSKYTFDTFVVGNSNQFAHAACLAVAQTPANAYNPLFLYGGVGLGKTHLMQAIGNHIFSTNPVARVVYASMEKFTNEFIISVSDGKMSDFRNRYRNVDVLLLDDIQFIIGKERTQEEFFYTFNELHGASKQIVITSDRPPKDIPTLEDRLRSRFEWGLIADIQIPDLETRAAILNKKAELEGIRVPGEVTSYIAEVVPSNIRELEGALIRVIAHTSLLKVPVSLEIAVEALKDFLAPSNPVKPSVPRIQQVVSDYFGVTLDELNSPKRNQRLVKPRQIAMYICRDLTDASLPTLGECFGGRDHTTVLYACEKIESMKDDPSVAQTLKNIVAKLNGNNKS
ncbi:MAG: chromosomal replication initiator protein DnaA [Armatimonadetes bacterium]|nr:chromosomal replication initiator protein DnaA [Armatimonadota bacterium]